MRYLEELFFCSGANLSIKLLCNFIEIELRHGFSPENLLHDFRTPFTKNTSRGASVNVSKIIASRNVTFHS